MSVLGGVPAGDHFHFLNSIRTHLESKSRSAENILHRDAVDKISVLVSPAPADVDLVVALYNTGLKSHHVLHRLYRGHFNVFAAHRAGA